MDNKTPTHDELLWMKDPELLALWYKRKKLAWWAVAIQKIQEWPRNVVAKLEEIHPESLIHDAVFPPKSKANDFSLFAGYFLEQVLGQYIPRIQSPWLLRDSEIQEIIDALEYYNYLRIRDYLGTLWFLDPASKLSMKNSQLAEKIELDDRIKIISDVLGRLKYQLISWQQHQK